MICLYIKNIDRIKYISVRVKLFNLVSVLNQEDNYHVCQKGCPTPVYGMALSLMEGTRCHQEKALLRVLRGGGDMKGKQKGLFVSCVWPHQSSWVTVPSFTLEWAIFFLLSLWPGE